MLRRKCEGEFVSGVLLKIEGRAGACLLLAKGLFQDDQDGNGRMTLQCKMKSCNEEEKRGGCRFSGDSEVMYGIRANMFRFFDIQSDPAF